MPTHEQLASQVANLQRTVEILARSGISSGQMRIQSISCQVSNRVRCNAGCRFCISRTTPEDQDNGYHNGNQTLDLNRLRIGLEFAKRGGAYTAILTGKADPLQEQEHYLLELLHLCREYIPTVDIHTNGFRFHSRPNLMPLLVDYGLTMATFSIAHHDAAINSDLMEMRSDYDPWKQVRKARELGLLVRCSLVLCKSGVNSIDELMAYIHKAKEAGAHQLVVRELWLPDNTSAMNSGVIVWNRDNKILLDKLHDDVAAEAQHDDNPRIKLVRHLPWGTPVYEIEGMNVTFARCEESYNGGTLKSLVHRVDGHGYMDWDHDGSSLY